MSFTVDLYSSKRKAKKSLGILTIGFYVIIGLFGIFFIYEFGMVVYGVVSTNMRMTEVTKQTEQISKEILDQNDKLNRYVISKVILEELVRLRKTEYDYKGKLDSIVAMLPVGTRLDEISFQDKMAVEIKVSSDNSNTFENFEKTFYDLGRIKAAGFPGLYLLDVALNDLGRYQSRFLLTVDNYARK